MKRILSITSFAILLLSTVSCNKEYVCECDNTSQTITAASKSDAEKDCNDTVGTNCKIK